MMKFVFCAALGAAACGKVQAAAPDAAAAIDAAPPPSPSHAVVSAMTMPNATHDGLDLDGDGAPDDAMGNLLSALENEGLQPQQATWTAVDHGALLLLADYEPSASGVTFTMFTGANPSPAPCASSSDIVCRHHLDGTGTFTIAGDSHHDVPLAGTRTGSTFSAGPGTLTVALAFAPDEPFEVTLVGARVEGNLDFDGAVTGVKFGGAITPADVDGHVLPGLASAMQAQVIVGCTDLASPPSCGCISGTPGEKWIQIFDKTPDCTISSDELRANDLVATIFAPDVTIDGAPGTSLGVSTSTVKAQF